MADNKDYEISVFRPISMGNEAAIAALVENVPDMNAPLPPNFFPKLLQKSPLRSVMGAPTKRV